MFLRYLLRGFGDPLINRSLALSLRCSSSFSFPYLLSVFDRGRLHFVTISPYPGLLFCPFIPISGPDPNASNRESRRLALTHVDD